MWRGMNVSFRDMLFLLVFAYLVISAVALAYVSKNKDESKGAAAPGNVIVDLRVQGPGDVPVGYSNKSGVIFNLLRDDLGHSGDPNSMNYEVAYGRGHWPGEYTVNAHLYRSSDQKFPIPVVTKVALQAPNGEVKDMLKSTVELSHVGQETTIFRFSLDDKGELVPGSVNRLHKGLRSAWQHSPLAGEPK